MQIFDLEKIKASYFKEETFLEGKVIYNNSIIEILDLKINMITQATEIIGKIIHNNQEYKISLNFIEKNGSSILVGNRSCTCAEHLKTKENCEHMAALIFYINNYSYEELQKDEKDEIYTSDIILKLENTFITDFTENYANKKLLKLVPHFELDNDIVKLTYKIGYEDSKLYSIKNLKQFCERLKGNIKFEYAKNFVTNHRITEFNYEAQRSIHFLNSKYNENTINEEERFIVLTPSDFALFWRKYENKTIKIMHNNSKEYNDYICKIGLIPFQLKLIEHEEVYTLRMEQISKFATFIDGGICSITENEFNYYKLNDYKLIEFLHSTYKKNLKIKKIDFFSFYDNVVVELKKLMNVECNFDVDKLYEGLTEICSFVDLDKNKNIKIDIKVKDGDSLLDLDDAILKKFKVQNSLQLKLKSLLSYYGNKRENCYIIDDDEKIFDFCLKGILSLKELVDDTKISNEFSNMKIISNNAVNIGVKLKSNLLEIDINVEDVEAQELKNLLNSYREKKKFHRLKNGEFIKLDSDFVHQINNLVEGLELTNTDLLKDKIILDKHRAMFIDHLTSSSNAFIVDKDNQFNDLISNINNVEITNFPIPKNLKAKLRSYQKFGFRYLKSMQKHDFGIILADDMGLGKTIQIICLILSQLNENEQNPSLIVCPSSLILNWEKEFNKFAPSIKVLTINLEGLKRKEQFELAKNYDVIITSYDLLKRDLDNYLEIEFSNFIIDEAQYIKNSSTQNYKSVKMINSTTKIALTGTPIENSLSELWSILNFVIPNYLSTYASFNRRFEVPIIRDKNKEKLELLKQLCSPFILRRLKKDVLNELPEKNEQFKFCQMSEDQQKIYQANLLEIRNKLSEKNDDEISSSKFEVLRMLMRLRQIACDPSLVYEDYKGNSAKVEMAIDIISSSIESGHKVLLFSQFTSMLEIIKKELIKRGISNYILTGSTKKSVRHDMAENFNVDDTKVFLISLKAGGTGLNLVGADIVIHFDPWWNMSAQNQATDRVYRIGQKNNVLVYKLITSNTIEEKIVQMQEKKGKLAESILEENQASLARLSGKEVLRLFD